MAQMPNDPDNPTRVDEGTFAQHMRLACAEYERLLERCKALDTKQCLAEVHDSSAAETPAQADANEFRGMVLDAPAAAAAQVKTSASQAAVLSCGFAEQGRADKGETTVPSRKLPEKGRAEPGPDEDSKAQGMTVGKHRSHDSACEGPKTLGMTVGKHRSHDSQGMVIGKHRSCDSAGEGPKFRGMTVGKHRSHDSAGAGPKFQGFTVEQRSHVTHRLTGASFCVQQLRDVYLNEVDANLLAAQQTLVKSRSLSSSVGYHSDSGDAHERTQARLCAVRPNSWVRLMFGLGIAFFCLADLFYVPWAMSWNPPSTFFSRAFAYAALAFWLSDMILNLVTGFYEGGVLVMNERRIFKRYIKGGFIIDITLNSVDIAAIILEGRVSLRFLRILKVNRLLRVIMILKAYREYFEAAFDSASLMIIGLGIRLVAIILLLNHVLCCIWFWIGSSHFSDTGVSWLDRRIASQDLCYREADPLFQYISSFHFTLTQITQGSTDTHPQNSLERSYTVVCIVIGMFITALLLAHLSARIVRIYMVSQEQVRQADLLARFLRESEVPWSLARRIEMQIQNRQMQKRVLTEKDVPALTWISTTLRQELCYANFAHHMITHTLFFAWDVSDPSSVEHVCVSAVEFEAYSSGEDVFAPFLAAEKAYLLLSGCLEYKPKPDGETGLGSDIPDSGDLLEKLWTNPSKLRLQKNTWFSTVALWLNWEYCGTLRASEASKLMAIRAKQFVEVLGNYPRMLDMSRGYAHAFSKLVVGDRRNGWCAEVIVDPAEVLMGCSLRERLKIMLPLLICLQKGQASTKRVNRIHRAQPAKLFHARNISKLQEQVSHGQCLISVGPGPELFLTVILVVLRISRPGGLLLVRIARQTHPGHVVPDVALPGAKLLEGETPNEAVQRVLLTKLPSIADFVVLRDMEEVHETSKSKSYGVPSMYKKNVYHAAIDDDLVLSCSIGSVGLRSDGIRSCNVWPTLRTHSSSGPCARHPSRHSVFSDSHATPRTIEWVATLKDGDSGHLAELIYAWLQPEEFARLAKASEEDVKLWLVTNDAPLTADTVPLAEMLEIPELPDQACAADSEPVHRTAV